MAVPVGPSLPELKSWTYSTTVQLSRMVGETQADFVSIYEILLRTIQSQPPNADFATLSIMDSSKNS